MRWPLRRKIMLPMAAIMLATVLILAGVCASLAVRATKSRIETQIAGVTHILQSSNFPLTDAVLQQMKALSGAEMLVLNSNGDVVSSSGAASQFVPLLESRNSPSDRRPSVISLGDHVWTRNGGFFHTVVPLSGRRPDDRAASLHIVYPEQDYRRAWQHAVYPALAFVAIALPVVMLLASSTAARISRRMSCLKVQVENIARGDFQQLDLAEGDDEIRALGQAVNRMAAMLARYEDDVRRTERTRTLARLGGGIAHQLRNSATGCRIALDLHAQECNAGGDSECLDVAKNQLRLMEEYIQRFLQLGSPSLGQSRENIDLARLVGDLVPLMRPAARHAGVLLDWQMPDERCVVVGEAAALTQLVINLLDNAIAAAAQCNLRLPASGRVVVALARRDDPETLVFSVSDNGLGPPAEVSDCLFEPFVTSKADGVGLGLSVVRDVAEQHAGRLTWRRARGITHFCVEFSAAASNGAEFESTPAADAHTENIEVQCA